MIGCRPSVFAPASRAREREPAWELARFCISPSRCISLMSPRSQVQKEPEPPTLGSTEQVEACICTLSTSVGSVAGSSSPRPGITTTTATPGLVLCQSLRTSRDLHGVRYELLQAHEVVFHCANCVVGFTPVLRLARGRRSFRFTTTSERVPREERHKACQRMHCWR